MLTRFKKRFLDLPISQKFVSIFAVMTLFSCALMAAALHIGLEEKLYEKSLQELDFFVQRVDDDLQQMDVLTRSIAVDTTIQSQLAQLTAADPEPGDDRRAKLTDALDSTPAALYCCRHQMPRSPASSSCRAGSPRVRSAAARPP